ncbi:MAG: RidA family protein [Deltaproteobacteria bacterium]|nr:RidA family protein [Deltaproteobacteria bacterium]
MPKEVVRTNLAPRPLADYSQAWTVSGAKLIFVAGQVSVDMGGNPLGAGDIVLQTRTALENMKRVLEGAGTSLRDVIKLNTYVTHIAAYREKTWDVRREYFSEGFPAATLVEVKSLARPEFMVEIEAVAATG